MVQALLADLLANAEPVDWRRATAITIDFSRARNSLGSPLLAAQAISALIDLSAEGDSDVLVSQNAMIVLGLPSGLDGWRLVSDTAEAVGIPPQAVVAVEALAKPDCFSDAFWVWTALIAARRCSQQGSRVTTREAAMTSMNRDELLALAAKTPPVSHSRAHPPFRNRPQRLDTGPARLVVALDFVGYTAARVVGGRVVGRDLVSELQAAVHGLTDSNPIDLLNATFDTRSAQQAELETILEDLSELAEQHGGTPLRMAADGGFGNDGPTVLLPIDGVRPYLDGTRLLLDRLSMPFVAAVGAHADNDALAKLESRLEAAKQHYGLE